MRALSVVLYCLASTACLDTSEHEDAIPAPVGRDLELTEEMRIDGMVHNLVPIGRVAVRTDGVIAISQNQDKLVRFFGRTASRSSLTP